MQGADSKLSRLILGYRSSWKTRLISKCLVVGLFYGYVSALHNQNPYYPVPKSCMPQTTWIQLEKCEGYIEMAWHWKPSPFWLPSYLLCNVPGGPGFGIMSTKSGYLFRSNADLILYVSSSTILGGLLGLALGAVIAAIQAGRERAKIAAQDVPGTD